ncbi:alanine/glycine:cation symporter family protein [Hydrocarboniphaga effusa]|uniref:alanine/glycine:cation symporter family protein n=1 Tax=Hydrocarboniphaga effusa TaxID=243629 RepID=UPI00313776DB
MDAFFAVLDAINGVLLSVPVLLTLLGIGLLFTLWSGFCQYRSLTHGVALVAGKGIDTSHGPGALTHFQALTAAMSGTVGLGAIAGMAIAVDFGGPGAVFWMWVVGLVGMALKTTEVTLSLLYRDTHDPENPHGGAMYVARDGLGGLAPALKPLGKVVGFVFAISLLLFAFTGGNMFQTWSVADTTREYFGVPTWITGLILAIAAGVVILGGIKRIGNVTKTLVPFKCGVYVLCGLYVIVTHADALPDTFRAIFAGAFSKTDGVGAFMGGTIGSAFMWGMKRALFSSEAGLGTAPVAHAAVKTPEPVTEGVVSGLEPFIDTIFVCTVTGLVVLLTGVWNRAPAANWQTPPAWVESAPGHWQPQVDTTSLSVRGSALPANPAGTPVFVMAEIDGQRQRVYGTYVMNSQGMRFDWQPVASTQAPSYAEGGVFADYRGSTLVAKGFDTVHEGLGRWLITIAVWVFGLSCIISYGYYGEQSVIYLAGERWVTPFRWLWCVAAASACFGFIKTSGQLDTLSTIGMGFMYAINLPLLLILGNKAMRQYHDYFRRLKNGEIARNAAPESR